jgi:uncharacterized protein YndB with AHSA1/START domain
MRQWTATTTVPALPDAVLDLLTDPEAAHRWAPIDFEVDDLGTPRLRPGSRARVTGRLAGRRVGFDIEVHEAADGRLRLSADGPVGFDVRYDLAPAAGGSEVRASVSVRPNQGLTGRLVAEATNALLAAGALQAAIGRIAREATQTARIDGFGPPPAAMA